MDLSSPMRSLIPTLDAVVLEVLAGTESALGVTQIHRLASRGSRRSFEPILDRLVEHGLVLAEPGNRGFLYRLNREHLLAPAVLQVAGARASFFVRMAEAVSRLDPVPLHASVFGSVARRDAGPDSDIDLFFVVPDDLDPRGDEWTSQIQALEDDVVRLTGNRMESLVFTQRHLRDVQAAGETIVGSLVEEGIRIVGVNLTELLVEVQR